MRRLAPLLFLSLAATPAGSAVAGETACWFENGAVVAPAAIGDMAGDFVIDLSAPRTLLHNTTAERGGYAGTALTLPVVVAGQQASGTSVSIEDLDYRGVGFLTPIIGVIGADILDRYIVTLDFAPCRLRLEPLGSMPSHDRGAIRVVMVGGVPTIPAAASDGLTAVSGPFALDTASGGGVRARGAVDGPRQKPAGTLRGLSLNGTLRQNLPAVVAGGLPDGVVGAFGVEVLSAYHLRLDPQALRLWLTPVLPPQETGKEKGPGVTAEP